MEYACVVLVWRYNSDQLQPQEKHIVSFDTEIRLCFLIITPNHKTKIVLLYF